VGSSISDMRTDQATTNEQLKGVVARLDAHAKPITRIQGDVAKVQIELAERRLNCPLASGVKDDLVDHIMKCPMRARMDAVEDFVTAQQTKQANDARWMSKLWPVIYAAGGIAIYILAIHSAELLKFLQR
jgi:hypothetical protein